MQRNLVSLIITCTIYIAWSASSFAVTTIDRGFIELMSSLDDDELSEIHVAGILPKDGEDMYEIEFWNSIKDSTHAEDYDAYLTAYPDGRFAPLAKVRAERYRSKSVQSGVESKMAYEIEDMNERYSVTANSNVRVGPSPDADKISTLQQGSSVEVTGRVKDKNWYRIILPSGITGYVYATLLSKSSSKLATESPSTTPPPTTFTESKTDERAFKDCPGCPVMVPITPGTFIMGDDRGDRSEQPAHTVTISKPFAIGKYEVTVAQWRACVVAGACKKVSDNMMPADYAPIRDVSWDDATDYTAWLSQTTGQEYRLPTEAEWELAARAGSNTTYWWGDKMSPGKANCKDCGNKWSQDLPVEVGTLEANPFGLFDMNGNVWEWVSDCWHKNYTGAPRDGSSWNTAGCTVRVIRGGSWRNDKSYVHSASRFKYDAYVRYLQNGFRVAKSL